MSQKTSHGDGGGLAAHEALGRSPELRTPADPGDGHEHANDHFALVYESEDELLSAVVPFVRQGLDRGEHCLYVAYGDDERETIVEALEDGGVDVEDAIASGVLSFQTVEETYLRTDPFDPDEMVSFYADAIEETLEEFAGFRVVAGMDWIDEVPLEAFMEYEGRVNELFEGTDSRALCHYDRRELSPDVVRDVINTHPHLIYDGTVCHNFYYTPPEELYGAEEADDVVDRLLGTLRDRAVAKHELEDHQRHLRRQNELTTSSDLTFEEKLQGLFELGCERFDLELGAMAEVDPEADWFRIEYLSRDHEHFEPGVELPLSETYCTAATEIKAAGSVSDPRAQGYDDITVYREFGLKTYLGTYVSVDGGSDRTFFFVSSEPRDEGFGEDERAFLQLMGQWVKYELERRRYQRDLEETVDRLRQSNDRLKQFAYAASHDLQEPLRMVSSYLQLLEREYGDDLDETAAEYIDFAVDGADRMRAMVQDLLAYSRVEQSEGTFEPVDCRTVLDRVTDDLRVRIEEADAAVEVGSLPTVQGDAEQLEQLFRNLLSNAIKYNDGAPTVEVTAERRGDRWVIAVADDGIGIDPAKADRIFEVFKRLHHDDEYDGTGIGLSLCQEIVDNHGGDISVDSEPGEGSTFSVTLPAE